MVKPLRLPLLILGCAMGCLAWAGEPVTWSFAANPASGDTVEIALSAACEPGWHIYALDLPSDAGPLPTVVQVDDGMGYHLVGAVIEPAPLEVIDPNFGMRVRYHGDRTIFTQAIRRDMDQAITVQGSVEFMACNDKTCLPPRQVEFKLEIPPLP